MSTFTILPEREEIPVADTWDTASIFSSPESWQAAFEEVERLLPSLAGFKGRLSVSPERLLAWLDQFEKAYLTLEKLYLYAYLAQSVKATDQQASARLDRARSLYAAVGAATAFAEPELMEIDDQLLQAWMAEHAALHVYAHYFQKLRDRQPHIRSSEVEEVLALSSDPFGTAAATRGLLVDGEMPFRPAVDSGGVEHEVGQGSIDRMYSSRDRVLRQSAWESHKDGYLAFKNTLANSLVAVFKQDVFRMRTRRYASSLEASLAPSRIPAAVFHNLIDTFKSNLPTWHRYWRLRRKALGVEQLRFYDIWAPLTRTPPEISFDQAVAWIAEGMAPLGEAYVAGLRRGVLEERWVDKFPNKGKRAGAFSSGAYGTHPYIMMSYNDRIFSLSTLAHELGHSMHSYLTWETQPWIYSNYSLFVAEVASNFNQALVRARLFETQTDPDFQTALVEETLANFFRYFFIMPSLARFELEVHERLERGEAVTADCMNGLMSDLMEEGFGGELVLDRERDGILWAQFGHLYANFYVYQYATGISAAHSLADKILAGAPGAVDRYLDFLKAGGSVYPLDALKIAGVDMTSPEPVEQTFGILAKTVDRLEKLTG